jgi:glutamine amidotransferase
MIVIVDTGGANHASIQNALKRLGRESTLSLDRVVIASATHVILPGVGHAGFAMQRLREAGLVDTIVRLGQPVLGICLGMQLLFEKSEEGDVDCLGILPGVVRALRPDPQWRVPNMGWSQLTSTGDATPLLHEISGDAYFYFVHSFAAPSGPWTQATTRDSRAIPALCGERNFSGVQFHPERSGRPGAHVLANFLGVPQ